MPDALPPSGPQPSRLEHIFLQALLEHLPDSVYFKDRDSRFLRVNAAMARKCGTTDPATLAGRSDADLFTAEHAQTALAAERGILDSGQPLLDQEEKETWPDGHITWVSTTKLPLRDLDGAIIGTFGISRDITARKLAAEEFRRSENALRGLLTAVPVGIALVRHQVIATINPMLTQIVGYAATELVGQTDHLLYDDEAEYRRVGSILGHPAARQEPRTAITRWRHKDGSRIEVEINAAPLDPAAPDSDIVITAIDISDRLHAEAERKEMQGQIDLSQKLESIGRLSAGIAHEINTPGQYVADNLRFLALSLQQLRRYFAVVQDLRREAAALPALRSPLDSVATIEQEIELDYLLQELPRCLEQSMEGMARIARIVGALKDFAHPQATGRSPANLARLIETAVAVSRHEWKYVADIATAFEPGQPEVPVVVDEINQALLNLIINAAHAVGAAIKRRGEQKGRIAIRTRTAGPHAVIEIEDNGTGIPDSVRPHLFEPFVTSQNSAVASGQGLYVVHRIVRRHGGRVEFETTPDHGTTFRLLLPLQEEADTGTTVP